MAEANHCLYLVLKLNNCEVYNQNNDLRLYDEEKDQLRDNRIKILKEMEDAG